MRYHFTQTQKPLKWRETCVKARQVFSGFQRWRGEQDVRPEKECEYRIIASLAVSLSSVPERDQVRRHAILANIDMLTPIPNTFMVCIFRLSTWTAFELLS